MLTAQRHARCKPVRALRACACVAVCGVAVCGTTLSAVAQVGSAPPITAARAADSALPAVAVSERHAREADDAYLRGAKLMLAHSYPQAEAAFLHAMELNPARTEYTLALAVARQQQVTALL